MVQLNNTFEQLAIRENRSGQNKAHRTPRTKSTTTSSSSSSTVTSNLPSSTTALLTLLSSLTSSVRRSPSFTPTLQHVKSLLYNKDYLAAFGTESEEGEKWRETYFARWTPARAVLYEKAFRELRIASVLGWSDENELTGGREISEARRAREKVAKDLTKGEMDKDQTEREVIMVGSGAGAELLALGCLLDEAASKESSEEGRKKPKIKVRVIDQGNWGNLVKQMDQGIQDEWKSLAPQEGSGGMELEFVQGDILSAFSPTPPPSSSTPSPPLNLNLSSPNLRLVTICFTITELLLQSRLATLRFLSTLTASAPSGLHLLIIESASLALIPIGTSGRTYPLGQLLDHALCGGNSDPGDDDDDEDDSKARGWKIVSSEEGKWYRMPEGAETIYNRDVDENGKGTKVKLENSRVVTRLYRKK